MEKQKKALVLGATGLVGSQLIQRLLTDARYSTVNILARRETGIVAEKLNEHIIDFDDLSSGLAYFAVDDVFCCLGTTIKKVGGDKGMFDRIDRQYVLEAATLANQANAERFLWVGALGSAENSPFFYSRVKGKLEKQIKSLGLQEAWVVQPALLLGDREEIRIGEHLASKIWPSLNVLLSGPMAKCRAINGGEVAEVMVALANGNKIDSPMSYMKMSAIS